MQGGIPGKSAVFPSFYGPFIQTRERPSRKSAFGAFSNVTKGRPVFGPPLRLSGKSGLSRQPENAVTFPGQSPGKVLASLAERLPAFRGI